MKVDEVMTKNPACCWPSHSAVTAATMMQSRDTGVLPVIQDRFTPTLVGVVTDRDLCLHVVAGSRDPAHIWVSECMTAEPVCCTAEDDVIDALERMKKHRVRRLPVVNEKHEVVGILALSDLLRKSAISTDEVAAAIERICQPRQDTRESMRDIVTAA